MSETVEIDSGSVSVDVPNPTVQSVIGSTDPTSPTVITRDGGTTIVFVGTAEGASYSFVQLPSDAQVGDAVEVYWDPAGTENAWAIQGAGAPFLYPTAIEVDSVNYNTVSYLANLYRKLSTGWASIR
jgi:hypothetical protein